MKPMIWRLSILLVLCFLVAASVLSRQAQQSQKAQQCKAILKSGNQCKRKAQAGSIYCWQHTRMFGHGTATLTAPAKKDPNAPAQTEPTSPAKTEPTSPAKTEPTIPAKTESTSPAKTEPTSPAKTEK
jgi:hypothetical protein